MKVILENDNISSFVDAMKESIKGSSGASGDLDKILSTSPQDALKGTSTKLLNKIEDIKNKIKVKIRYASGKLKDYKNKLKTNLAEKVNNTADNLKNKLNDNMDSLLGTSGNNDKVSPNKSGGTANQSGSTSKDSTGLASFFSFRYSDYLKLFLLIGLYTNESGVFFKNIGCNSGKYETCKK